jgi:hypothetical protein
MAAAQAYAVPVSAADAVLTSVAASERSEPSERADSEPGSA